MYVLSELEGDFDFLLHLNEAVPPGAVVFSCGDDGFSGKAYLQDKLDQLAEHLSYTFITIGGNHDNHHWLQTKPRIEDTPLHRIAGDSILFAERGGLLKIGETAVLCFGGGASSDAALRIRLQACGEDPGYWPDELPGLEDYERADRNLGQLRGTGNEMILLTHTGADSEVKMIREQGKLRKEIPAAEGCLNSYLERILKSGLVKKHYFGHFHCDSTLGSSAHILYRNVREVHSGETVESSLCRMRN